MPSSRPASYALLIALAAACGGSDSAKPKAPQRGAPGAVSPLPLSAEGLGSQRIDTPDDPTTSLIARRGTDALIVTSRGGHTFTHRLDATKGTKAEPLDLGAIGVARSIDATQHGYVLLVDDVKGKNHALRTLLLDNAGKARGEPIAVATVADDVPFAHADGFGDGGVVIWEVRRSGETIVNVAAVDKAGVVAPPRELLNAPRAWQYVKGTDRLAIAIVTGPNDEAGTVEVLSIDAKGAETERVRLPMQPAARPHAELAIVDGATVVAFTEVVAGESSVKLAVVRAGKTTVPPKRISTPRGDEGLVALVSDPHRRGGTALVAIERDDPSVVGRAMELYLVGADGAVRKERSSIGFVGDDRPDFVASGDGFAALTLSTANPKGDVLPTFIGFDPMLTPQAASSLWLRLPGKAQIAGVAFNLTCDGGICGALTVPGTSNDLHWTALDTAHGAGSEASGAVISPSAVARRFDLDPPPRIVESQFVTEAPSLSQLDAVSLGEGRGVVGWVTYYLAGTTTVEAAPKGEPPYAATLALRFVAEGRPSETVTLSKRAISEGGIAITDAPAKGRSDAVIAWTASDKGVPQVFATRVDDRGKKIAQKKITVVDRGKGTAPKSTVSSVAIARVSAEVDAKKKDEPQGDGFVVGWVDTRDGNGEVYVARINRELEKTVVDKRITQAEGDAADVNLLATKGKVYVAFSDSRGESQGDIYLARLDGQTLELDRKSERLYASPAHSRSPKLAACGDKVLIGFIDDIDLGAAPASSLRIGVVGPDGSLGDRVATVAVPGGTFVTSFDIACSGTRLDSCRVIVSLSRDRENQTLGALTLKEDGSAGPLRLLGGVRTRARSDTSLAWADPKATNFALVEESGSAKARWFGLGW